MMNGMNLAGDPTVLGWTTFALYLIAAALSFREAAASRKRDTTALGHVWSWIAVALLVLGVNKQLDLQSLVIHFASRVAQREHVYEYRRAMHALFFLGLITLSAVVAFRWLAQLRAFARQFPGATIGCALVGAYIVARAASIDKVDQLLRFDLERVPFLWVLEVGGLALVIVAQLKMKHEN